MLEWEGGTPPGSSGNRQEGNAGPRGLPGGLQSLCLKTRALTQGPGATVIPGYDTTPVPLAGDPCFLALAPRPCRTFPISGCPVSLVTKTPLRRPSS